MGQTARQIRTKSVGVALLLRRWAVERTLAWLNRNRRHAELIMRRHPEVIDFRG